VDSICSWFPCACGEGIGVDQEGCCQEFYDTTHDGGRAHDLYVRATERLDDRDFLGAERLFKGCLKWNNLHTKALYHLGVIYEHRNQNDIAQNYYEQVLTIDECYQQAHRRLGCLHYSDGKLITAENYLKRAVALDPNDADGWITLGLLYICLEKLQEAVEALLEAIAASPTSKCAATAFFNIGNIHHMNGQPDEAIESFSKTVQFDPNNADALFNLGVLHQEKQNIAEAYDWYEKALTADADLEEAKIAMNNIKEYMRKKALKEVKLLRRTKARRSKALKNDPPQDLPGTTRRQPPLAEDGSPLPSPPYY